MLHKTLPLVVSAVFISGCEPAARCDRHLTRANDAVDSARAAKSGLGKLDPDLLKASAKIASAEAHRINKDYEACIRTAQEATTMAKNTATP